MLRVKFSIVISIFLAFFAVSCSEDETVSDNQVDTIELAEGETSFTAEVWADNWFAMYANGELVGEDSVPITTERSFNQETFSFAATYPLAISLEAKDYKEDESGLEYIGERNQQMGDGGIIAQITDNSTGEIVLVTDENWKMFVQSVAPLDKTCETSGNPSVDCEFQENEIDGSWFTTDFDDNAWDEAVVWSEAEVDPKMGYDEVTWETSAKLIWGTDLEQDNTVLFRTTVEK